MIKTYEILTYIRQKKALYAQKTPSGRINLAHLIKI